MPSIDVRERHVSWRRLLAGGVAAMALIAVTGGALELWWFGSNEASAGQRAEREIHQRFDGMVRAITAVSDQVGELRSLTESLLREHRKEIQFRQFQQRRLADAIAEGALIRLKAGERCFEAYRAALWK